MKEREISVGLLKKSDIGYNTMYNFVMGKTNAVSYDILETVCNTLGVNIEDILEIKKE